MELLFATHNLNKVREIAALLPEGWQVRSLYDLDIHEEIPETADTIAGNAEMKVRYLYERLGIPCLAEDSGLEVAALGGAPGVHSARYAGETKDMVRNMDLLLHNMAGSINRAARFVTVVALMQDGDLHLFPGTLEGEIGHERRGSHGFGYDPVFVLPDGRTLAELTLEEKSAISHRSQAVKQAIDFLKGGISGQPSE
jgi:XTP/dITP diphosphohydrolase